MPKPTDKFRKKYVDPAPGPVLVVGSHVTEGKDDDRKLFETALGVDMRDGKGVDLVHDMEKPLPKDVGPFAHVHCVSVLEHCRRPWRVAETIERVMLDGSTIYIRVPSVWRHHDYPDDYWRPLAPALKWLFPSISWLVVRYEDPFGDFHVPPKLPTPDGVDKAYWRCELHGFGVRGPLRDIKEEE